MTVKRYPESNQNTRARHWFAGAILDVVLYRGESKDARLALAVPSGFTTCDELRERTKWLREVVPSDVYCVDDKGRVCMADSRGDGFGVE